MPERPVRDGSVGLAPRLILASGSPQRRAILEQIGVSFDVVVSGAEEIETGPVEEVVLENAFRKARAVADLVGSEGGVSDSAAQRHQNSTDPPRVLGVDTLVALGPRLLAKPADPGEAADFLRTLSGRTHRVLSGLCVIEGERVRTAAAATQVTFRALEPTMIDWYVATGEWRDRAGGYAIQGRGAVLVEGIEGDYLNVVGLPVPTLLDLLPDLLQ